MMRPSEPSGSDKSGSPKLDVTKAGSAHPFESCSGRVSHSKDAVQHIQDSRLTLLLPPNRYCQIRAQQLEVTSSIGCQWQQSTGQASFVWKVLSV
eukprot:4620567-Amphidinium_carterae.1